MAAGVVAAVYLLGAIVVALRLWVARLPGMSVIGGLPRESLVAVGLAQVLGIALGFAAILAGILFSIDPAKPRDHHRRFNEKTRAARPVTSLRRSCSWPCSWCQPCSRGGAVTSQFLEQGGTSCESS